METGCIITQKERAELEIFAANIRKTALQQIASAKKGHVGGTMSVSDTIAVLYGREMRYDPKHPRDEERDRLVMSKGHCGCSLYAALLLKGFFPEEWKSTLNKLGTRLPRKERTTPIAAFNSSNVPFASIRMSSLSTRSPP